MILIIRRVLYKFSFNKRLRDLWIKSKIFSIKKNSKILDAGAGEQQYKKYCSNLKYTSQDICEYSGKGNSQGLQTLKWDTSKIDIISDITRIPVQNKSFDVVLCTEVLEHVFDPLAAIKEFKRILKPNGSLIITIPFRSLTHFAPYHYSSGFNKYWIKEVCKLFDFEIKEIYCYGNHRTHTLQEILRSPKLTKFPKNILYFLTFLTAIPFIGLLYIDGILNPKETNETDNFGYCFHVINKVNDI